MRIKDKPAPRPPGGQTVDEVDGALDDTQGSLDDHAIWSRVPARMSTGVSPDDAGHYVENDGRTLGVGYVHAGRGRHMSVDAGLDGGAWAEVTRGNASGAGHTGVFYQPGWVEAWHEVDWASRGGTNRAGGAVIITPEELGLGASVGRTTASGITAYSLFAVLGRADRQLVDLGPAKTAEGEPARRLELRTARGASLLARPGVGFTHIGIGGQLNVRRDRDVTLRATVPEGTAREALNEAKGVLGYFRDKARALGAAADPVPLPDLSEPDALAPGDEVVVATSGSVSGGVFVGAVAGVAAQAHVQGDFELAVKKHDDHHVELAVTPRKIRGGQIRAGAALLLDVDRSRFRANAFRQAFVFDLRAPAARAAYQKALRGELPGGYPEAEAQPAPAGDEVDLERRFHEVIQAEPMPSGVQRSFVELLEVSRAQSGWGLGFGVWRRGAAFIGLGRDVLSTVARRTRVGRRTAGRANTRAVEARRYTLISGVETEGVHASVRRATTFDPDGTPRRRFAGLVLEARLADTKVRGDELNTDFIDKIREVFGVDLPRVSARGAHHAREVRLRRVLDEAALERLARARRPELRPLAAALDEAKTPVERADAVQDFLAREGLPGLGAIHLALGGDLEIETEAAVYDAALDQARTLQFRFAAPLAPDAEAMKTRLKAVEANLDALEDARALALEDPFVEDGAALVREIDAAAEKLEATLDVSHFSTGERLALVSALERGWTTALERRCIERLTPGA